MQSLVSATLDVVRVCTIPFITGVVDIDDENDVNIMQNV